MTPVGGRFFFPKIPHIDDFQRIDFRQTPSSVRLFVFSGPFSGPLQQVVGFFLGAADGFGW